MRGTLESDYLSDLEAACARADARKKKPTCKLMQGEVVASTDELRRMIAVVRAAIRVAYSTDLMKPSGHRSWLDLREALAPFVTHDGRGGPST